MNIKNKKKQKKGRKEGCKVSPTLANKQKYQMEFPVIQQTTPSLHALLTFN